MLETATAWLDSCWFPLLIAVYLVGMMLHGHSKGFVRLAVSCAAVFITFILVRTASPYVTGFLKENTAVQKRIEMYIEDQTGIGSLTDEQSSSADSQERVIEGLPLSENIQKVLRDNNTEEMWEKLGVAHFREYLAGYLSNLLLNQVSFLILFVVIWIALRLLLNVLDIFTMIPVIHGLNQIAGAVLGLLEGLLTVWIVFLVIGALSGTGAGARLMEMIRSSVWMNFLFRFNPVMMFLNDLAKSVL